MDVYELPECYGVAGAADALGIETTILSSCSAVIMYSPGDGRVAPMLGLFHYPAMSLEGSGTKTVLKDMMNYIHPTEIVVWRADINSQSGYTAMDASFKIPIVVDNQYLAAYVREIATGAPTVKMKSGGFPGVFVMHGQLTFDQPNGRSVALPDGLRQGRTNGGGLTAFFYAPGGSTKKYDKTVNEQVLAVQDEKHRTGKL